MHIHHGTMYWSDDNWYFKEANIEPTPIWDEEQMALNILSERGWEVYFIMDTHEKVHKRPIYQYFLRKNG